MPRVIRHRVLALPAVLACATLLGACSSDTDPAPTQGSATTDVTTEFDDALADIYGDENIPADALLDDELLARFPDCGAVAPALGDHLDGLEQDSGNGVSPYAVSCMWMSPGGERSVGVTLAAGTGVVSDATVLEAGGMEVLDDDAIDAAGGVAYALSYAAGEPGPVVTTVELPDVQVSVTGGHWADGTALGGAAAVRVVTDLLDL